MIRYVAIGAVVGFLLSVFLLSRNQAPPPPPPEPPAALFQAPAGIRQRAELRIPEAIQRRGPPMLQQQVGAVVADGGP